MKLARLRARIRLLHVGVGLRSKLMLVKDSAAFHLARIGISLRWTGRDVVITVQHRGRELEATTRDDPYTLAVFRHVFAEGQYAAVPQEDVATVVDLGANIGAFVLWAAAEFPAATIVAVEPHPDNYRLLRRNVDANGLAGRTTVLEAAVSGSTDPGVVRLYDSESSTAPSLIKNRYTLEDYREVRAVTLSDLCTREGLGRIDVLKCDIEGAEAEVLSTLPSDLAARIRLIMVEYHSDSIRGEIEDWAEGRFDVAAHYRDTVAGTGVLHLLNRTL